MASERSFTELCQAAFLEVALEHAAIRPRGYDSTRAREELHVEIDSILDTYLEEFKKIPPRGGVES